MQYDPLADIKTQGSLDEVRLSQCGAVISVNDKVTVISCPETNELSVYNTATLEKIADHSFGVGAICAEQMRVITKGNQTFVFYSIREAGSVKVGRLELITQRDVFLIDFGEIPQLSSADLVISGGPDLD